MLQVSEPNPRTTGGEVSGILVLRMPCSRYVGVVGFGVYHPILAVGFFVGCFCGAFWWGIRFGKGTGMIPPAQPGIAGASAACASPEFEQ